MSERRRSAPTRQPRRYRITLAGDVDQRVRAYAKRERQPVPVIIREAVRAYVELA